MIRITDGEAENEVPERVLKRWQWIASVLEIWIERMEQAETEEARIQCERKVRDWHRKLRNYEAKMMSRSFQDEGRYSLTRLLGAPREQHLN